MADKTVTVRLQASTAQYQAQMAKATATTRAFGTTVGTSLGGAQKSLGGMTRLGGGLRGAVANPLAAIATPAGAVALALAGSAKAAMDWESAWTGVTKTVEGTPAQMAGLEQGLRDLTSVLPASHQEIAGVAEAAGQLGIETDNILGFTRTMIDLGETTNLTSEQAATNLAQLANITQMAEGDFDRLGSTIVQLGNDGASTEAEIAEMGLRIAGAGHQVGMSEADILGFAEALASLGIRAEMGGSAISRVMMKLHKVVETGGDALTKFAAVAGMSAEQFAAAFRKNAPQAIVAFTTGLGQMEGSGMSAISVLERLGITEQRTSDMLLRLAGSGDLVAESIDNGNAAWKDNSALSEEAEKRYATTAAQIELFKNNVVDLAITLGDVLLPVINGILGPLSKLAGGIGDAISTINEFIDPLNDLPGIRQINDWLGWDQEDLPDRTWSEWARDTADDIIGAFDGLDEPRRAIDAVAVSLRGAFKTAIYSDFSHSSRELNLLAEAFDDTAQEAEELSEAIDALVGVHLNLDEAAVQFRGGLADLRTAIEDNGATLDLATEKGRENRSAFTSAAQSALDLANAQIEAGVSIDRATQNLRENVRELKAEAIAAGLSEDAVEAYLKRLNLTPDKIRTLIELFDDEAQRKLDSVQAKMNALNGKTVKTFVDVVTRSLGNVAGSLSGQEVRHGGGVAGTSGARRYYMGAPSLRGDEFSAILQRGEVVFSRAEVTAAASAQSSGSGYMDGRMRVVGDKAFFSALIREDRKASTPPPRPVGNGRRR